MKSRKASAIQSALFLLVILIVVPGIALAHAQAPPQASDLLKTMNQPVAPFHIIGNIYYVGSSDIGVYLIVTPVGDILLDGGFVETAPQIEANIQTLGFKLKDVKFILNSHAHLDHAGGISEMKHATGAKFVAMDKDVPALTAGTEFSSSHSRSRDPRWRHRDCRRRNDDGPSDAGTHARLHDLDDGCAGWRQAVQRRFRRQRDGPPELQVDRSPQCPRDVSGH